MNKLTKQETEEEIKEFFENIEKKSPKKIKKIKKLAMRHNIKLRNLRKKFCKKCYSTKLKTLNIKKVFLTTSIAYFFFYIIMIAISLFTPLYLSYNRLRNYLTLGIFILPLIPILWFCYIKNIRLRAALILLYSLLIVPLYFLSSLGIILTIVNIISSPDNGYRSVFEKILITVNR